MKTENEVFDITAHRLADVVTLDFRTAPNTEKLGSIGYGSIHFQLSPKDAVELGMLLLNEGSKK